MLLREPQKKISLLNETNKTFLLGSHRLLSSGMVELINWFCLLGAIELKAPNQVHTEVEFSFLRSKKESQITKPTDLTPEMLKGVWRHQNG